MSEITIYQADNGTVEVRLEQNTVWLRQGQMSQLFGEGELGEESNVQNLHIAGSDKPVKFYNLDVIISIGYRVKSPQGTRFRQWATRTLQLVRKVAQSTELRGEEGRGFVDVVTRYAQTFLLLQRYDESLLSEPHTVAGGMLPTLAEANIALAQLKADLMARGGAVRTSRNSAE